MRPWMSSGLVSQRTRITRLALAAQLLGLVGVEHHSADAGARRRAQAGGDDVQLLLGVKARVKQLVQLGCGRRA